MAAVDGAAMQKLIEGRETRLRVAREGECPCHVSSHSMMIEYMSRKEMQAVMNDE